MTGYCKYCGKLIEEEDMIHAYDDDHRLKWTGCLPCYMKRIEQMSTNRAERRTVELVRKG